MVRRAGSLMAVGKSSTANSSAISSGNKWPPGFAAVAFMALINPLTTESAKTSLCPFASVESGFGFFAGAGVDLGGAGAGFTAAGGGGGAGSDAGFAAGGGAGSGVGFAGAGSGACCVFWTPVLLYPLLVGTISSKLPIFWSFSAIFPIPRSHILMRSRFRTVQYTI